MKTHKTYKFKSKEKCVTALGCFDGVHIGHARLIEEARRVANSVGAKAAVWSFDAPPRNYFSANKVPLITTSEEKKARMKQLGVDIFVSVPFSDEIFSLSAEDFFVEVLIKRMNSCHLVCGYNYRFGRGGAGDANLLSKLCLQNGIGLSVIPEVTVNGTAVSSSEIRNALSIGNLQLANAMLGRPYSLKANVSSGQHLGRKLGFPTVNQIFVPEKLIPLQGVYVSKITFGRSTKYGITNVGNRPTVSDNTLCAETHIFDYEGDLYGKTLVVELIEFLRPERKFTSLDELTAQVNVDINKAKNYILNYKKK